MEQIQREMQILFHKDGPMGDVFIFKSKNDAWFIH